MGAPNRSKSFHEACHGDMGDNTLPDQVVPMASPGPPGGRPDRLAGADLF